MGDSESNAARLAAETLVSFITEEAPYHPEAADTFWMTIVAAIPEQYQFLLDTKERK